MLVARPLHGRGLRVPASPAPIFASSQEAPKLATLYEAPDSIPTNHTAQRLPSCPYVQEEEFAVSSKAFQSVFAGWCARATRKKSQEHTWIPWPLRFTAHPVG